MTNENFHNFDCCSSSVDFANLSLWAIDTTPVFEYLIEIPKFVHRSTHIVCGCWAWIIDGISLLKNASPTFLSHRQEAVIS